MRIQITLTKTEKQAAEKTLAGIKSIIAGFKKFSNFIEGKSAEKENKGKLSVINKMVRKPGAIVPSVKDSEEGRTAAVDFSEELVLDSLKITERFFEYFTNISMMFAPVMQMAMFKWGEFHGEYKAFEKKYERSQTVRYVCTDKNGNVDIPFMLIDSIDFDDPASGAEAKLIKRHELDTEFTTNSAFTCDFGVTNGVGKVFVHIDGSEHLVFDVDVSRHGEDFKTNEFANEPEVYRIINVYMAGEVVKPADYDKAMYLIRALKASGHIKEVLV